MIHRQPSPPSASSATHAPWAAVAPGTHQTRARDASLIWTRVAAAAPALAMLSRGSRTLSCGRSSREGLVVEERTGSEKAANIEMELVQQQQHLSRVTARHCSNQWQAGTRLWDEAEKRVGRHGQHCRAGALKLAGGGAVGIFDQEEPLPLQTQDRRHAVVDGVHPEMVPEDQGNTAVLSSTARVVVRSCLHENQRLGAPRSVWKDLQAARDRFARHT